MNVWLGGQFYLWVRHYETAGASAYVSRPTGVEGWLPIAGMMNLKYLLLTGRVPELHPAAMFLLFDVRGDFVFVPQGVLQLAVSGGDGFGISLEGGAESVPPKFSLAAVRRYSPSRVKYLLLGFFVWAVSSMSAEAIAGFMQSPYGIVADVKMLKLFRYIGTTGLIVLGVLAVASVSCRTSGAGIYVPMERCWDCRRCSARFAFGGMNRHASIARSVRRLVLRRCR